MLIAASPVEIETRAEEAGLSPEAHETALQMFHALTDQIGQATAALGTPREEWPTHRFYFGRADGEMAALLHGLEAREDLFDVTHGWSDVPGAAAALYVQQAAAGFMGVLVAHETHEGYRAAR